MDERPTPEPWCPSADPSQRGSVVLGVVGGTAAAHRLGYLTEPQPVSDELLALTGPVAPTEVFRFAAPCAASACAHFSEGRCRLAVKIVRRLPVVADGLLVCRLRPRCRWWRQEGGAVCRRCPMIVTETANPSERLRQATDAAAYAGAAGDHLA